MCLRLFATEPTSPFDVISQLTGEEDEAGKKKASLRVMRLVDEIMSLSLIEAAHLCDLCQEKLAPGDDTPIPGRMAFPHPMAMFPGGGMPGMMPGFAMPQAMPVAAASSAAPAAAAAPAVGEPGDVNAPAADVKPKKEEKKEFLTVKLLSFETAKKINVVKEVRALTQLGLKEAKELVEGSPKVVKKGVPAAEAEAMRDKLVAAGAEVSLE